MRIRKCSKNDTRPVGAFYDRVVKQLEESVNYPKWIYRVYPSEISVRAMIDEGSQYVCEDGGGITGAFVLNTDPQGSYRRGRWSRDIPDGSYTVLHALAVDPSLRGQGIASEIIDFCAAKAKAEGYGALRLDIVPDNLPARRLFEKNGFAYAGDADLERHIGNIPVFSLFELDLS